MKKIICFIILICILISCKTTTEPKIYDKKYKKIDEESELIHILIKNGNFIEADIRIERNLKLYPNDPDILQLKGWLLLNMKNYDESEELFLSLLKNNDRNPLVLAALARINRINGNKEAALEYIRKGLALSPLSILWFERGIIEYEKGDYKKALTDFNKAYNVSNKNSDAYFFKYLTLLKLGREIDEIKQYWETILENSSAESWYFLYHANLLYELGIKELAFDVIKNGIDNYPNDSYLLNMHAYLLYENYEKSKDQIVLDEALEQSRKCITFTNELKPEFIDTYFLILLELDQKDNIKKEIKKYFLLFPDSQVLIDWRRNIE